MPALNSRKMGAICRILRVRWGAFGKSCPQSCPRHWDNERLVTGGTDRSPDRIWLAPFENRNEQKLADGSLFATSREVSLSLPRLLESYRSSPCPRDRLACGSSSETEPYPLPECRVNHSDAGRRETGSKTSGPTADLGLCWQVSGAARICARCPNAGLRSR
jgi:hypothetical protein